MSSITTKILIEIRDEIKATRTELRHEIRATNSRLDETNSRLDETNSRLDETNSRLGETNSRLHTHEKVLVRLVDLSERHEHALGKLVTSVDSLNGRFDNFLTGAHQQAHEETRRRVEGLDERVTRLEEGGKPTRRRVS
jgi:chromosome segregation ATPase